MIVFLSGSNMLDLLKFSQDLFALSLWLKLVSPELACGLFFKKHFWALTCGREETEARLGKGGSCAMIRAQSPPQPTMDKAIFVKKKKNSWSSYNWRPLVSGTSCSRAKSYSWGGSISTDCMLCPLVKLIHSYHVDFSELHLYIPNCPQSTYNSVNPQHPQLSTYKLDSVFIHSSPQTSLTLPFFPFLRRWHSYLVNLPSCYFLILPLC